MTEMRKGRFVYLILALGLGLGLCCGGVRATELRMSCLCDGAVVVKIKPFEVSFILQSPTFDVIHTPA